MKVRLDLHFSFGHVTKTKAVSWTCQACSGKLFRLGKGGVVIHLDLCWGCSLGKVHLQKKRCDWCMIQTVQGPLQCFPEASPSYGGGGGGPKKLFFDRSLPSGAVYRLLLIRIWPGRRSSQGQKTPGTQSLFITEQTRSSAEATAVRSPPPLFLVSPSDQIE